MKKLTPTEAHARSLVKRLIAMRESLTQRAKKNNLDTDITQQMADGIGVERETISRWVNWTITPRGLSVPAIERYLERMEG